MAKESPQAVQTGSDYKVVQVFPHDPAAFTQGLAYADGYLYESTGLLAKSSVRVAELATGRIVKQVSLAPAYFGEGITLFENKLIQLTWKSQVALIYDPDSLKHIRTVPYPREGWGLTHDGSLLIASEGTSDIFFLNPSSFDEVRRISVSYKGSPVLNLNELQYVKGQILANIWHTDLIIRICPETGDVLDWINLERLLDAGDRRGPDPVFNGIAFDKQNDRLFVTAKMCPKLFQIDWAVW